MFKLPRNYVEHVRVVSLHMLYLQAGHNLNLCSVSCGFHYRVESAPSMAKGTKHQDGSDHTKTATEASLTDPEGNEDPGSFRRVRVYEHIIPAPIEEGCPAKERKEDEKDRC